MAMTGRFLRKASFVGGFFFAAFVVSRPAAAQGESGAAEARGVEPPVFLEGAEPTYPSGAVGERHLELILSLDAEGRVVEATVEQAVGDQFEGQALEAARGFRFSPARRAGVPVPAKIRFPVHFHSPSDEEPNERPSSAVEPASSSAAEGPPKEAGENPDAHLEITVHGERELRTERRSASDVFVHREVLAAAPRSEGADTLLAVPGLVIGRGEGLAVAHSYTLRGFDAEHGQDIEFSVGGLPINLPSHIHGQGYADLGFLLTDVVDELRVSEGVSDPKQGDFAVAGSIRVGLGVDRKQRGLTLRTSYGSFDTFRQQVTWAPKEGERESFGAVDFTTTDGYGENRSGQAANAILQHRFGEGRLTYRAIGFARTAESQLAGVVRRDDVDAGKVDVYGVYPYPTAEAQNSLAQRLMAGIFADYRGPEHATGSIGVWVGQDNFRIQQNYTGFLESSRSLAGVSGRGDLFEQRNKTDSLGMTGRYRTEAFDVHETAHGTFEVGADARFDRIAQEQNLLDAQVRSQTWDERVDASISGMDLGFFGDLDFQLGSRVTARLGARADVLSYEVEDRLGNFVPLVRPDDAFIQGYRRSAMGIAAGPRTSVSVRVLSNLQLLASYGQGYRSPQARTLEDGESAPFTKVNSGDVGFRLSLGEPLELSGSAFATHLSDDSVFDPTEGTLVRTGATSRLGGTLYALSRPTSWLVTAFSLTYVHATLLEPPPATASEPAPPFQKGAALPYVPPLVMRLDMSVERPIADDFYGNPLVGRVGTGLSYRHSRPLPYGEESLPVGLVDASLGLKWRAVQLSLEGWNLFDRVFAVHELSYVSNWDPNAPPSRVPARHLAVGPPRSFLFSVAVTL